MADDNRKVDVRTLSRPDWEKAKRDVSAQLLKLSPRYRLTEGVPVTMPDKKKTPVTNLRALSNSEYQEVKEQLRRSLSGFGNMKVSPGLPDDTPKI